MKIAVQDEGSTTESGRHAQTAVLELRYRLVFANRVAATLPVDHDADVLAERALTKHASTRVKRKLLPK